MTVPSSLIDRFRTLWTDRFIDAITIDRVAGRGTFNDATLVYDGDTSTQPYSGSALIRPASTSQQSQIFGQQQVTGRIYAVYIPWSAVSVQAMQPEDLVTVTASAYDAALVGETMRILTMDIDSYRTRTRLICRHEEGSGYVD